MPALASPFGAVLRQWRSQRKLSQLELALACNVSQRHLSFLESGRAQPSRAMVLQLAEAMEVPLRERNTLLQSAGFAPVFRQRDLSSEDMAAVRAALRMMLEHHEPYPAMVVDRDWNLLMGNDALNTLFAVLGDTQTVWRDVCGDAPPNVMRLTFHRAGLRPYIANWAEFAPLLLQRLHAEAVATRSHAMLALINELRRDPDIPSEWIAGEPGRPLPPVLPMALQLGDARIELFSMITTFGTPQDVTTDEIRVESFFPANEETERLLRG